MQKIINVAQVVFSTQLRRKKEKKKFPMKRKQAPKTNPLKYLYSKYNNKLPFSRCFLKTDFNVMLFRAFSIRRSLRILIILKY